MKLIYYIRIFWILLAIILFSCISGTSDEPELADKGESNVPEVTENNEENIEGSVVTEEQTSYLKNAPEEMVTITGIVTRDDIITRSDIFKGQSVDIDNEEFIEDFDITNYIIHVIATIPNSEISYRTKVEEDGHFELVVPKNSYDISFQIRKLDEEPKIIGYLQSQDEQDILPPLKIESSLDLGKIEFEESGEIVSQNETLVENNIKAKEEYQKNAPQISAIENVKVKIGELASFNVKAYDPNGRSIVFKSQLLPFVDLLDMGNGEATIEIAPSENDAGKYTMIILAKNDLGFKSKKAFKILVTKKLPIKNISLKTNNTIKIQTDTDNKKIDQEIKPEKEVKIKKENKELTIPKPKKENKTLPVY
jgi:hypothetical protein